jgi:hypothetical protein
MRGGAQQNFTEFFRLLALVLRVGPADYPQFDILAAVTTSLNFDQILH